MAESATQEARFTIVCLRCERPILARRGWVGHEVKCPHCMSLLRVPPPAADGSLVRANRPALGARSYFNFACPGCKSLLEVHDGMSGTDGVCPSCGSRILVPYIDRNNGLPDPGVLLDKPKVTPDAAADDPAAPAVHAYAAAGGEAPRIVRTEDGERAIECPRCREWSPIDADACVACGTPFTMDAAATVGKIQHSKRTAIGVTLAVVGVFSFPLLLPSVVGLVLGLLGLINPEGRGHRAGPWTAAVLGLLGVGGGIAFWIVRML